MKLEDLNKQILECNYCPYQEFDFNETKELGFGKANKILFIGVSPAVSSNKTQGNSKFDLFFQNLLSKINIKAEDYYFTNLVKTSIPRGMNPGTDEVRHCMSHLKKEILIVNPQIIIPLGSLTREAFEIRWPNKLLSKFISIGDLRKKFKVFPIAHPGSLHYHPEQEEAYLKTLKKATSFYSPTLF